MGKNSSDFWSKESYRERGETPDSYGSSDDYRSHSNRRSFDQYHNHNEFNHYNNDDQQQQQPQRSKYHSHHRHHKNHHYHSHHSHKRRSRSRSRSQERNTDSSHGHHRDSYYDSDRSYSEERKHRLSSKVGLVEDRRETPNDTLMIRNLPPHIVEKDINYEISRFGLYPRDIRLMKNKETGVSRGFAFIEFNHVDHAKQLKEMAQGCLSFGGEYECSLHYTFPKDGPRDNYYGEKSDFGTSSRNLGDWSCSKCGCNNFKRRDECFKCGSAKDISMDDQGGGALMPSFEPMQPSNVLMLRNLSLSTTEETILMTIGSLCSVGIKALHLVPDPYSQANQTNMCAVQLHNVNDAMKLHQIISSMENGLVLDGLLVTVSYGQRMEKMLLTANTKNATKNAALAALAAAQWQNLSDDSNTKKSQILEKVTINNVEYQKYPTPEYSKFQYDSTSGFYYDSSTGFYYDNNSQYFYNSKTQKYMYYDTTNQIYITVDNNSQPSTSTSNAESEQKPSVPTPTAATETPAKSTDKAKMAKKIAKDMEKWAKMVTKKQEQLHQNQSQIFQNSVPCTSTNATESESLSSNVASSYVLEKQLPPVSKSQGPSLNTIADDVTTINSRDPFEIMKAEEEKLIDHKRLACLLCKRQFNSKDLLQKHQQLSDLHKTNLSVLRRTLLNEEQLEHVEKVEREMGYRDRAKERRDKYGIDDTPQYPKGFAHMIEKPTAGTADMEPVIEAPALPISNDNIGNRMLKAMGWTEGTGLGKSNQGMSGIIQVERRKSGLGLGNRNSDFTKESYKEAVRRTALERFREMNEK